MLANAVSNAFENQRGRLLLWWPVFMAVGIGIYFALMHEPDLRQILLTCALGAAGAALFWFQSASVRFLATALALVCAGFVLICLRSAFVAAPILERPYYGGVEGRIIGLDRSAGDAPRVLLDEVVLFGMTPDKTPERVRVSLQGWIAPGILQAGNRVVVTARVSAPSAPVEPGGFDFRQMAWFERLGGVGYSRDPALLAAPRETLGFWLWLLDLRQTMTKAILEVIPGRNGAFATAITTGDLSELDKETLISLRASSLAHMYSISGLHMSLLTAFVFGVIRYGLALVPALALRVQAKKIAAVLALGAALFYLLLSGVNVATQRSFIMIAVVLVAVMLDRAALSMRSIAISAIIVLALFPESLTEAGFQMSYAATIALIAGFEGLNRLDWWRALNQGRWRWLAPVWVLVITSILAGAATGPIGAFHFNRITQFGLIANVLAVPLMGMWVMPAAVVAAFAALFGLQALPLTVMGWGIGWILAISDWVAGLGGSVRMVPAGPNATLVLLALGACFALLWRGRVRFVGFVPIALGFLLWAMHPRPDLLVAEDGRLVGVQLGAGRVLSAEKGNGFSAENWLANDGDGADQPAAFQRVGFDFGGEAVSLPGAGMTLWFNRTAEVVPVSACGQNQVVIAPKVARLPLGDCLFLGQKHLIANGATAIWRLRDGALLWQGAKTASGMRPWTQ